MRQYIDLSLISLSYDEEQWCDVISLEYQKYRYYLRKWTAYPSLTIHKNLLT